MKFNYSTALTISVLILNMAINFVAVAGDSPTRLQLLNADWNKSAVFNRELHDKQMQAIERINVRSSIFPGKDKLEEVADILWPELKGKIKNKNHIEVLPANSLLVAGYTIDGKPSELDLDGKPTELDSQKRMLGVEFRVDATLFENLPSIKGVSSGKIRVFLACYTLVT